MSDKLDAKFYGEIRKAKDDSIVPDDEWVVFLAKDNAFAAILWDYLAACRDMGADIVQIEAVERLINRVTVWRLENRDKCKVPDAVCEKMLD